VKLDAVSRFDAWEEPMLGSRHKRAVLRALRSVPDYTQLAALRRLGEADGAKLLQWLDQSGLSFYLLSRLFEDSAQTLLPQSLLHGLEQRLELNRARTSEWLRDFELIIESLGKANIPCIALKGLALVPEYCPRFALRHQVDIDLWIDRTRLDDGVSTLAPLGFSPRSIPSQNQMSLLGPGDKSASLNDSIYKPGRAREVELHFSLLEHHFPVELAYAPGQWQRAVPRHVENISFLSLAPVDMFLYQAYHAFKHLLGYWARASWLYELARFLDANHDRGSLWTDVCNSIGENVILREVVGLVVDLVGQLFAPRISPVLGAHCLQGLSAEITGWNRHFGERIVFAGPMGDKAALLIQKHFIRDPDVWSRHFRRRLFPLRSKPQLPEVTGKTAAPTMADYRKQLDFLLLTLRFHAKSLLFYPFDHLRWRLLKAAKAQG
jgi:hypothetical protein